jgi:hypothetical protein
MLKNFKTKKTYINWKYERERNPLTVFLELYPDKIRNFLLVSLNPNITIKHILNNSEKDWNWDCISQNESIAITDVLEYPELPWNCFYIFLKNFNMDIRDIISHNTIHFTDILKDSKMDDIYGWDNNVSEKDKIIDILKHPEMIRDFFKMPKNDISYDEWNNYKETFSDITISDILSFSKKCDWYDISENPNITVGDMLKYPELPWKWNYVSKNPSITVKDVLKHPEIKWDWFYISDNKFLWHDTLYKKNLKIDIEKRRDIIRKLKLFGNLNSLVQRYIGYI